MVLDKVAKLLPTIAQRKNYDIKRPAAVDGGLKEPLCCWEVENINMLEVPNMKEVRVRREQHKLYGQKIQRLSKLVSSIKEVRDLN
jgi:hypothetical protein